MGSAAKKIEGDELALVAAVLERDRKAMGDFVGRYTDGIYAYVRHRLLPRADFVEDLVQDVFLAALRQLPDFRGESSLKQWLLGIARHKVEDHYRKRLRQPLPLDDLPPDDPVEWAPGPHMDELLDRERAAEKAAAVLAGLPEIYSTVLLWRYWEKRSTREMAAGVDKSEKAIERILARARAEFKRRWNDDGRS